MSKRSLWGRLRGLLGRGDQRPLLEGESSAASPASTTGSANPALRAGQRSDEDIWLESLIAATSDGNRLDEVASDRFWERIDGLWRRGQERLASTWLEKFLDAPGTPASRHTALRRRLVAMLDERGDLQSALPHLEALLQDQDEHATYAHYLLGEHYRRRGDERRALRHYEAVLARDVTYPNVRARVERLRRLRGEAAATSLDETIASVEALAGAGSARYALMRELGRGATGVVYLARDLDLAREVAVKLLHPHLATASRADACARFFEEARATASLRHPNIIAVLDLDEQSRRIVMELAAGGTLRTVLRERGPRPMRRALERHVQLLSALAAAHQRGIVHRDVKPGNLMFRRDPDEPGTEIVLGDFGIAHLPDAQGATGARAAEAKKPTEAVGTLAYMSPEQRQGASADPRSDLYAAAVVLFEMLTGAPPWPRDILLSGKRKHGDLRLPETVTQDIPSALVEALASHLDGLGSPQPEGRPDTEVALSQARELRDLAIAAVRANHAL